MKAKRMLISLLITVIVFGVLIYTQKKLVGIDSKVDVLIAKQNTAVKKYDKLDKSLFDIKSVPAFLAVDAVASTDEITNMYAQSEILGGEILKKQKIGQTKISMLNIDPSKRKIALPVSSVADIVGGQIFNDGFVDILFTNNATTDEPDQKTQTLMQKVKVIGIADSRGALLDTAANSQVAAIILEVSPKDAHLLANKLQKGKFTFIGVSQNSEQYDNIIEK